MKWVEADEKLPDKPDNPGRTRSKCVLVYCPDIKCKFTGCYNFERGKWEYFAVGSVTIKEKVSHWRELPDGP